MPTYQQLFSDADKKRSYANALTGRAMQSHAPVQQGRITPKMGIGHGLTQIAEALLARRAGKKANEAFAGAEEEKRQAMVAALSGTGGQSPTQYANAGGGKEQPLPNQYAKAQEMIDAGIDPGVVQQYMQNQQPAKRDLTDDMKEYEFARQQGFQGSLQDFMIQQRQAGATTIRNEGSIPAGFEMERDAQGNPLRLKPIAGGPADLKAQQAEESEQLQQQGAAEQGDIVTQEIDRTLGLMDEGILPDTGFGSMLSGVPGTDANAISNLLTTIKANVGFEQLNKMRQSSPTGGALGQVSEKEIGFLQSVAGSLEQSQRKEDLTYNLNRLWNAYQDVIHGQGQGPERRALQEQQGETQQVAGDPLSALTPEQRQLYGL